MNLERNRTCVENNVLKHNGPFRITESNKSIHGKIDYAEIIRIEPIEFGEKQSFGNPYISGEVEILGITFPDEANSYPRL